MGTEVLGRYPWKTADFRLTGVWGRPQKVSGAHAVPACEVVRVYTHALLAKFITNSG